jgi:hypothetical protein
LQQQYLDEEARLKRKFIMFLASGRDFTWFHLPLLLKPRSLSSASDNWDAIETRVLEDAASIFSSAEILELRALGDIVCGRSLSLKQQEKYQI